MLLSRQSLLLMSIAALALFTPNILGHPAEVISSSLGSVQIINACPFTVNSNIVHAPRPGSAGHPEEVKSTMQPSQRYDHPFTHDPNIGVSWKLARDKGGKLNATAIDHLNDFMIAPVQFEWTWVPEQRRTYWDLSMIDAKTSDSTKVVQKRSGMEDAVTSAASPGIEHDFAEYGISVEIMVENKGASMAEIAGTCATISCPKDSPVCRTAYNVWDDWSQQHDCPQHVTLRLTLCK